METNIHPLQNYNGCINTISAGKFSIFEPKIEQIEIKDIARGLSNNSHFGGHCPKFFSIAQHSILVFQLYINDQGIDYDTEIGLLALLHDAPEAYIGDMIKPLKIHFPAFKEIENKIMSVIAEKFHLDLSKMDLIKKYDLKAQQIEYDNFYKGGEYLIYLSPEAAYEEFLLYFEELINS